MSHPKNGFYFRVIVGIFAQGDPVDYPRVMMTLPELKAFEQNYEQMQLQASDKISQYTGSEAFVGEYGVSLVTERTYRKEAPILNKKGYAKQVINEVSKHVNKKEAATYSKNSAKEDDLYHQVECKTDHGPNGNIFTVYLSDSDFQMFKKIHDPKTPMFTIATTNEESVKSEVCIMSYVNFEISSEVYKILAAAYNTSGIVMKLLARIEEACKEDEKNELSNLGKEFEKCDYKPEHYSGIDNTRGNFVNKSSSGYESEEEDENIEEDDEDEEEEESPKKKMKP